MPEKGADIEALFREYRPRLFAWLERRIPDSLRRRIDPEDVLQEAFVRAVHRHPGGLATTAAASSRSWIYQVVHDCYLEEWERHTRGCRDHRRDEPWPDHSSVEQEIGRLASATTPSEAAVRADERKQVLHVMEQLTAEEKEVLELRWWEGFSHAETAAMLNLTPDAARQRYFRAFKRFSGIWQQRPQLGEKDP